MKCNHGVPYEFKCASCMDEALNRVKTLQQEPATNASKKDKTAFWKQVYKNEQPTRK